MSIHESMNFHPDKQIFQVTGAGIKLLTLGLQGHSSTPIPRGTQKVITINLLVRFTNTVYGWKLFDK